MHIDSMERLRFFPLFTSELAGLLAAWLSTTPPYFATTVLDFIGAMQHFKFGCTF